MPDPETIAAHLIHAVELADQDSRSGGRPFGAVVVLGEEVLAVGLNTMIPDHDPTAHAEVNAIREACRRLETLRLDGAVLYASCEPCPLCQATAIGTGIERAYFAVPAEDARAAGWPYLDLSMRLQIAWRAASEEYARHHEIADPERPFTTWRELAG